MKTTEKARSSFKGKTAGIVCLCGFIACVVTALVFSLQGKAAKIYSYTVTYRGETTEHNTESADTEAVLESMGIDLDDVVYTESKNDLIVSIDVKDLFLVSVLCDGNTSFLSLEDGATVSQALEALNVTLDENDRVSAAMEASVEEGMQLTVYRVEEAYTDVELDIPYETETVENSSMEKGTTKVKTEGVKGVKKLTYKSVYVDGIMESYEFCEETVVTEPVTEVVEKGTKVKQTTSTTNKKPSSGSSSKPSSGSSSKPSASKKPSYTTGKSDKYKDNGDGTVTTFDGKVLKYSKVLNIKASAYTYMNNKMDITASGAPVQVGIVAAHKNTIPMGTKVYIVGKYGTWEYGVAIVGDTGCAAGKVDLFMTSYDECMEFGVRGATVYILE